MLSEGGIRVGSKRGVGKDWTVWGAGKKGGLFQIEAVNRNHRKRNDETRFPYNLRKFWNHQVHVTEPEEMRWKKGVRLHWEGGQLFG